MDALHTFNTQFDQLPLVAILRGLTPTEAPAIGEVLTRAGFGCSKCR
jgi:2-dehydro-3-deoxyphosphogalactonate aldolase